MERLTERSAIGNAFYPHCFDEKGCAGDDDRLQCGKCDFDTEICERLAAYEDTNLTPEQILEIDRAYREKCEELAKYQQLEEEGLLLRLPCKVGDTVYVLAECKNVQSVLDGFYENATGYYCPYLLYDNCPHDCEECEDVQDKTAVFEDTVICITYNEIGLIFHCENTCVSGSIGDYIFLTQAEAEQALKRLESEQK